MALFSIYDGRASFWQWDVNQKFVVSDSTYDEIHFSNGTTEGALVCKPYIQDGICMVNVPNILLQTATPLRAFVYIKDKSGYRTTHTEAFTVIARPKPSDYIYTETETLTVEQAVQDALQDAKESGDFKGDPGPKGDPGVVKFVVVPELPETDTENAIYLLPDPESAEGNLFDEWIYVDGKWEKLGSAVVQVDLTNYVKNTDFANSAKAGVVRCENFNGVSVNSSNGGLLIFMAQNTDIDAKVQQYRPIVPANLDYAVKKGLADSKDAWTEEEKTAARDLIGATGATDYATTSKYGVVKLGLGGGIYGNNGILYIHAASKEEINNKITSYKPISPSGLDYAVKVGVTTNSITLTDEEKAAAQQWLGVSAGNGYTPCIIGSGPPSTAGGAFVSPSIQAKCTVGSLYLDTKTPCLYACTAISDDGDTWARLSGNESEVPEGQSTVFFSEDWGVPRRYEVISGMTWEEFLESEYNVDGFVEDPAIEGAITRKEGEQYMISYTEPGDVPDFDNESDWPLLVRLTDKIIPNYYYLTEYLT